jgi:cytochrome c oxidase cbb3-type subunit 3
MADMPSDFWGGWIAVVTIVSLVGLGWLVFSVYFGPDEEREETEGPVWDSNLREGSSPAPMWWFWLILAMMVFSVIYLMLYPGLGSYQGALRWSQGGRLNDSLAQYQAEFGGMRALVAEAQVATLQSNPDFMASAQRVFDRWQWGGSEAQIEQSIRAGRTAVMVGWEAALGEMGVEQVVDYVGVLGTAAADGHPGQTQYNQFCVACHGIDGSGNPLYGSSREALVESVALGRGGVMPAFGERLDDTQVKLLVALLMQEK